MTPLHEPGASAPSDPGSLAPSGFLDPVAASSLAGSPAGVRITGFTTPADANGTFDLSGFSDSSGVRTWTRSDGYTLNTNLLSGGFWIVRPSDYGTVAEAFGVPPGVPAWNTSVEWTATGLSSFDSLTATPVFSLPAFAGSLAEPNVWVPAHPGGLAIPATAAPEAVASLATAANTSPDDPGSLLEPGGLPTPGSVGPLVPDAPDPPVPGDAVRYSPQTPDEEKRRQALSNLGLSGAMAVNVPQDGNLPENDPADVCLAADGTAVPAGITRQGVWLRGADDNLVTFAAMRGVDGWVTSSGGDSAIRFRWKGDSATTDKDGFILEFESPHLVAFANLNLTAGRKYQVPNHDGTLALAEGPQVFSGPHTFSGPLLLTGTAMSSPNAATSRKDIPPVLAAAAACFKTPRVFTLTSSGSGATHAQNGDDYALFGGTAAGGYARYVLARNLTSQGAWGSPTLDCSRNFEVALGLAALCQDPGQVARILFGAPATPAAGDASQSLSGKGWGIEMRRSSSVAALVEYKLVAYNATWAISSSPMSVPNYGDATILLRKEGGTLKLWAAVDRTSPVEPSAAPNLTLAGAPTSGAAASVLCVAEFCNASATPSLGGALRITSGPDFRIY